MLISCFVVCLALLATTSSSSAAGGEKTADSIINDGPYKILIALPLGSKSHKNVFWPLAMGLAGRGHQVTIVSSHKPYKQVKGITEITLDGLYELLDKASKNMWGQEGDPLGKLKLIKGVMDAAVETCNRTLNHWSMKPIFEGARSGTAHFDVVIASAFFNECVFPLAQIYQAPLILVSVVGLLPWLSHASGFRDVTSFMTSPLSSEAGDRLSFLGRLANTVGYLAQPLAHRWVYWPQVDSLLAAKFGDDAEGKYLPPSRRGRLADAALTSEAMTASASLVFLNTHLTTGGVRPLLPSVVEVGGMHCVPPNPLPKDLEQWLSGGDSTGFVVFSLGSVVTPDMLSEDHRKAFVEAFSKFPKFRFIWKWNADTMSGLPANVKVSTWLPQQDLLGHRKVRAFITHGGLLSTQEAAYHGVPLIGLPVGGDQQVNMKMAVNDGIGVQLSWSTLNADAIVNALKEVTSEPRFRENLQKKAAVFKDQLETPVQRAVFWTEHVVRHNGAPHLRSGSKDLYWWQFYLLDVWAVLLAAILIPTWVALKIARAVFGCLCSGGGKKAAPAAKGGKKNKATSSAAASSQTAPASGAPSGGGKSESTKPKVVKETKEAKPPTPKSPSKKNKGSKQE